MAARTASARWEGTLTEGAGVMKLGSGAYAGEYSFKSRFGDGVGTNPEELIAAAHAGCFSMSLSNILSGAGFPPASIDTIADVRMEQTDNGFAITRIDLQTTGSVPGIDAESFATHAQTAKAACPVSKALAAVEISLVATLVE